MPEATHIYTGPCACGCVVDGVRQMVHPGDRVAFGPDDLDARAADRLGEHFVSLSDYVPPASDVSVDEAVDVASGPAWARVTVAELAAIADGFEAFSKGALAALCRIGGLSSSGSVGALRDRLFVDLEATAPVEAQVDDQVFSSIDDIDKMDPEFGLPPEAV